MLRRFELDSHRTDFWAAMEDIFETFVLCCSDPQIFTGAAYGITMRYYRQCVVTAYHYNIISAMLLISCATHILAVAAVRQYWRHKLLAFIRVVCVGLFLLMTTMFIMNQNAHDNGIKFPTTLSRVETQDELMFLPAACFQSSDNAVISTLQASTESVDAFVTSIKNSTPGWNVIQGWPCYVIMMLYYGLALIAAIGRVILWCFKKGCRALRTKIESVAERPGSSGTFVRKSIHVVRIAQRCYYCVFLGVGIAVAVYTTKETATYIYQLRDWAHKSGWMPTPNTENEATTFGQLVPALSCVYIVFGLAQVISGEFLHHSVLSYVCRQLLTERCTTRETRGCARAEKAQEEIQQLRLHQPAGSVVSQARSRRVLPRLSRHEQRQAKGRRLLPPNGCDPWLSNFRAVQRQHSIQVAQPARHTTSQRILPARPVRYES